MRRRRRRALKAVAGEGAADHTEPRRYGGTESVIRYNKNCSWICPVERRARRELDLPSAIALVQEALRLHDHPAAGPGGQLPLLAQDLPQHLDDPLIDLSGQARPTQLATVHIKEQRLERLSPEQRDYLQRYVR